MRLAVWLLMASLFGVVPRAVLAVTGAASPPSPDSTRATEGELEILTGGADKNQQLPLIVAIHGLGDTPENFADLLVGVVRHARVLVPRGIEPWGEGYGWAPSKRAQEPNQLERELRRSTEYVAALIRRTRKDRGVNGLPLVLGFSQGAMVALALAVHHPTLVGMALPIAGYLPAGLRPTERRHSVAYPPIVALHGDADRVIPYGSMVDTATHLRRLGLRVEMHPFAGVGHGIPWSVSRELMRRIDGYLENIDTPLRPPKVPQKRKNEPE